MSSERPKIMSHLLNKYLFTPLGGQGVKALALKGAVWTITGFGTQKILQLASNLILTRILFPEAFGLMALVNVCMVGLGMFSEVGINAAIIQNKRGEDQVFLNTAWTIKIIRGFLLWGVASLIAYPAATLYAQPQLFPLLIAVGSTAAINGFQTTAIATNNRNMRLGRMIIIQLSGQIITIFVMVILALIYQSVWALAIGGIVGALATVMLGHLYLPSHRHKLGIEKESFDTIFKFGRWILLATLVTFMGGQGILAIQGTLVSLDTLAFIYVAGMFAMMAVSLTLRLLSLVIFPILSKISREEPERLPMILSKMRNRVLGLTIPAFLVLSLTSTLIIDVLYDERYAIAGTYLAILAINGAIEVLPMMYQNALLARGDSRTHFILMVAITTLRLIGLFVGFHIANIEGMLAGIGAGSLAGYFVVAIFAHKEGWLSIRNDILAIGVILIGACLSFALDKFV